MTIPNIVTITYDGDEVTDQLTTDPWFSVTAIFPDHGGIPYLPQFNLEILQPVNVDGARYRIGGTHFPAFRMITITPVYDYNTALVTAREMELIKGGPVILMDMREGGGTYRCQVLNIRALANAKRVINSYASTQTGGVPGGGATNGDPSACVDAEWTLQVLAT